MDASTNGHAPSEPTEYHDQPPAEFLAPKGFKFTVFRVLGVIAFLLMALFWIWAFNNRDSVPHADEFDDPAYTEAAEAICSKRQATIREFPLATEVDNPIDRGLLVERGTAELEAMVAELKMLPLPSAEKGAEAVPQWLADWDLYLTDRVAYTEVLATGSDPAFLLSANPGGARVTDAIQTFAEVNQMASCSPSGDV